MSMPSLYKCSAFFRSPCLKAAFPSTCSLSAAARRSARFFARSSLRRARYAAPHIKRRGAHMSFSMALNSALSGGGGGGSSSFSSSLSSK
jgi:hypothetical protein